MKDIILVWDFDLTLSEEYQQIPLFTKYFDRIKEAGKKEGIKIEHPLDYFTRCDEIGGEMGITYMQRMVWDAQEGGCLEGLTQKELFELGKKVTPTTGLKESFIRLQEKYRNVANIHNYIISVGLKDMIEGFIQAQGLNEIIEGIKASEFHYNKDNVVDGIKAAIVPFKKNQPLIEIMKGNPKLLNKSLPPGEYKFNYKNLVVIGDGFSDVSKFAFSKKKGATPVCVYKKESLEEYQKAQKEMGPWADYILPRDFKPENKTYENLTQIIDNKISQLCDFSPENLYNYHKGKIKNIEEKTTIENHISRCTECSNYTKKVRIPPKKQ